MTTWPHVLMVATILVLPLLGQPGGGATDLRPDPSTKDAPSELRYVTFRVLGLMKTKSGAT